MTCCLHRNLRSVLEKKVYGVDQQGKRLYNMYGMYKYVGICTQMDYGARVKS